MEDLNCWKEKFEICEYAKKLLDKIEDLNAKVKKPIDLDEVKKVFITLVNIMVCKCVNQVIRTIPILLR